jgi:transaldolase
MRLFIDSADIGEIREAAAMGAIDGVTTNPSLLAKAGKPTRQAIVEICEAMDGPVSVEVLATSHTGIVDEGRELHRIHPNVVVKVPLTIDGLKALRTLSREHVRTNATLCFSSPQGLLAAKAGATYVSPFIGRLDDLGHEGMELVEQLVNIWNNYDFTTEILVASVRHPTQVVQAALLGAHAATVPFQVIAKLIRHPMTDLGLARFLEDARRIPKE